MKLNKNRWATLVVLLLVALGLLGSSSVNLVKSAYASQNQQPAGSNGSAAGKPANPKYVASPDVQTINGSPLSLNINDDTSTAIDYNGTAQYYGGNAEGAYMWYNGMVYGPGNVPAGDTVNAWNPISNVLTGSGTTSNPWFITTVVSQTDIQLTQRVEYINGNSYASYTFQVSTPSGASWTLFHTADLYTEGNDQGYPYYNSYTGDIGGRSVISGSNFYQYFRPLVPATHYEEGQWHTLWDEIGTTSGEGSGYHDTTDPNQVDNMAGLQWNKTGPQTINDLVVFNSDPHSICNNPFSDVASNPFFYAINYLYCAGVVNGTDATHYSPAGTSTRGQFAKVVVLGFGTPFYTPTTQDFTDVPPSYFGYLYVESGYHAGVLSGFDANTCAAYHVVSPCYLPNVPITRGQLTKLVVNAAHYPLITPTSGQSFTDVPPSNVFYVSIETAHGKGVINGYPNHTFNPNGNIRRDEMAQIVYTGITTP